MILECLDGSIGRTYKKMKTIYITRRETFNAAHKLVQPLWSDEKNEEVFGKCANKNWHGHNFELIVTVKGMPDPDTGFVYDLKQLGDLIKAEIIDKVDHKNLNLDVDFMFGKLGKGLDQIDQPLKMLGWWNLVESYRLSEQYAYLLLGI